MLSQTTRDEPASVWRDRLLSRLLVIQLFFLVLAVVCLAPQVRERYGSAAFAIGLILLLTIAAALLPFRMPSRARLGASIGTLAVGGFTALYFAGSNGVSASAIEAGLVLATLLLGPKWRVAIYCCIATVVLVLAIGNIAGFYKFSHVDLKDPLVWWMALLLSAPGFAVVLFAQAELVSRLQQKAEELAFNSRALWAESDDLQKGQAALVRANEELDMAVAERAHDLESIRSEFQVFSDQSLSWLIRPLQALLYESQALLTSTGGQARAEAVNIMERLSVRIGQMLEMIDGLRAIASVGAVELVREPTNLSELARKLAAELQESETGHKVDFAIEPNIVLEVDPGLASSALRNLLENAWKFTASSSEPRIVMSSLSIDGVPGIRIEDNGAGFDSSQGAKIFEPFHRASKATESSGSGIGLSTVRQIVRRHGGVVTASSTPGNGAKFELTFGSPGEVVDQMTPSESAYSEQLPLSSEVDWRHSSLSIMLGLEFAFAVGTLTILTLTSRDQATRIDLAGYWCATAFFPVVMWLRPMPFRARALMSILPLLAICLFSWSRTSDFTGPMTISLDVLCFCLLFLGRWEAALAGLLIAAGAFVGFRNATALGAHIIPSPANAWAYWAAKMPVAFGPGLILIFTLRRALDRISQSSIQNSGIISQLRIQKVARASAYAEAERLNRHLDALAGQRTDSLKEAVEALSTFTGTVGHDLRGPIRSLSGFATILQEDHSEELGPEGVAAVKAFGANVRAIGSYIERLISLARSLQADVVVETVDLSLLMKEAISDTSFEFTARIPANAIVDTDPRLAKIAISCIVENLPQGGDGIVLEMSNGFLAVKGCSNLFLEVVDGVDSSTRSNFTDIATSWPPLAFARICRRSGGRAWVERDTTGERWLCFTLAAAKNSTIVDN